MCSAGSWVVFGKFFITYLAGHHDESYQKAPGRNDRFSLDTREIEIVKPTRTNPYKNMSFVIFITTVEYIRTYKPYSGH
jgi:hypothetical protein